MQADANSDTESLVSTSETPAEQPKTTSWITYCTYLVYFLFWVTLYAIAIQLSFGTVYFMISMLIAIYLNTRTEPRKENEPSAYSVFNEGCESLDGTFKAEMFEKQLGLRQL